MLEHLLVGILLITPLLLLLPTMLVFFSFVSAEVWDLGVLNSLG